MQFQTKVWWQLATSLWSWFLREATAIILYQTTIAQLIFESEQKLHNDNLASDLLCKSLRLAWAYRNLSSPEQPPKHD